VLLDEVSSTNRYALGESGADRYGGNDKRRINEDRKLALSFSGWLSQRLLDRLLEPLDAALPIEVNSIFPGCLKGISLDELVEAFQNEEIEKSDFLATMKRFKAFSNLPDSKLHELFSAFDADSSGVLSRREFLAGAVVLSSGNEHFSEKIARSFSLLDANGNGYLEWAELHAYCSSVFRVIAVSQPSLEQNLSIDQLANASVQSALIYSKNGQQHLTCEEFSDWLRSTTTDMHPRPSSIERMAELHHTLERLLR
jgi:Ca2+-binding EF-hand superfamily protein